MLLVVLILSVFHLCAYVELSNSVYKLDYGWMTGERFPVEAGIFLFATAASRLALGPPPASYLMGIGTPFPGGKAAGRESHHSRLRSVELKNEWSYTSTPSYVLMAWYLGKHSDIFACTLNPLRFS
jgi:hypothetical protein